MRTLGRIGCSILLLATWVQAGSSIDVVFDGYSGTFDGALRTVPVFDAANLDPDFAATDATAIEQRVVEIVGGVFLRLPGKHRDGERAYEA